ncbi:MAG: glycosyltransferase family 2 protein, partial [Flavobacteriales bacterium]|nr:glycosyltransferase family 2 protein [Flavobacteriales bacterium]
MDISIVVPLYNEEESLKELHAWIARVIDGMDGVDHEVIFVDDGSKDNSWKVVEELIQSDPKHVRGIRFQRNYGKSPALNEGFKMAQGEVVITMDADLQDSPEEIPELRRMLLEDGFDMVSGWKKKRHDPLSKTIPTKLYNWATRKMSGIYLHDFNCGLKAYRLPVVKSIEVFGEMHRYIPVLAKRSGYDKIGEKVVQHQARKFGESKFGWERFVNGFLDLLTITFIARFGKKPMHLFGSLGSLMFFLGFVLFAWIGGEKVYYILKDVPAKNITDISGFYIALVSMILGVQLFLAGFLG